MHILPYFGEEPLSEVSIEIEELLVGSDDITWGNHGEPVVEEKLSLRAEDKFVVTDAMKQQASIKFTKMVSNLYKQVKELEVKFELPTFPSLW